MSESLVASGHPRQKSPSPRAACYTYSIHHSKMRLFFLLSLLLTAARCAPQEESEESRGGGGNGGPTFDYIVVGSGPGGGPLAANLARAGHSTLLIEAGDDQTANTNVSLVFEFAKAWNDPATAWDFWVKHSEDEARNMKYEHLTWRQTNGSFYVGQDPPPGAKLLGVWYPRAGTLGGCSSHNGAVTFLPLDNDWNEIARITGDSSWRADKMRKYFVKVENNTYLTPSTPGHGYNGFLSTTQYNTDWIKQENDNTDIFRQLANATGQNPNDIAGLVARDVNELHPQRDEHVGPYGIPTHAAPDLTRRSSGTYVKATLLDPARYPLTFKPQSLVTKILFDKRSRDPKAIGVEILEGEAMYSADRRYVPGRKGRTSQIYARKEVIISGGTFNSPQILKLSGIGPRVELQRLNIPVVKDSPGVGEGMADNYESSIISLANKTALTGGGAPISVLFKTPTSSGLNRNVFAMCGMFSHEGFWPTMPTYYGPSEFECAMIHMNPKSAAGYVRLNSANPQGVPDINFRFFERGENQDLTEILDAIKTVRKALKAVPGDTQPWNEIHPCPGRNQQCSDAKQKEWIKLQAFGHHATSTNQIGADNDRMAVLDSKFRVRGVQRLRVVDASVFPVIPGAFPVLPTFMIAEKATEDILAAANLY